jgi:membrane protease subunit HflC
MHWPILVLGLVVAVILLCALFCFRVREVEHAFIVRLGEPVMSDNGPFKPGLHLKIPFIDRVWRYDRRLKAFSLDRGQIEQTQLADEHAVLVSTFVFWRVADPLRFYEAEGTVESAKNRLGENVRNARHNVLGRHRLDELLNVNPEKLNLDGIEEEMLQEVREAAKAYGVRFHTLELFMSAFPNR